MDDIQRQFSRYMRNAVAWFLAAGAVLFLFGFYARKARPMSAVILLAVLALVVIIFVF